MDDFGTKTKTKMPMQQHKPVKSNLTGAIDLGFCPVSQTTTHTFYLQNLNDYEVDYNLQIKQFTVSPNEGILQPGQKQSITLSFTPTQATAIIANLIISLKNEKERVTKVSAIGKYPFIALNLMNILFDKLLIGKIQTKEILIKNSSQVQAQFHILKIQDDDYQDNAFSLDVYHGLIPPKSTFVVKATFTPSVVGFVSLAHYKVVCPGGNDIIFQCTGEASGFEVALSTNSINFGEIQIESETSRLLTVFNNSDLPTVFEFFNDNNNIFGFSKTKGIIPPKSSTRIIVYFRPKHTICYYERVFGIIRNHSVLYVDLMGTCYDLLIKPIPIMQKHVDIFRARVTSGKISEVDFKYMENSLLLKINNQSKELQLQSSIKGNMMTSSKRFENPQGDNYLESLQEGLPALNQTVLHKEMFQEPTSANRLLVVSEDFLDFGFCEYLTVSAPRDLIITNQMASQITIFWTIQKHISMDDNFMAVFSVTPECASIQPNSSFNFQVHFRPAQNANYFFQYLQLVAFKYNPQLTKKIIEDAQKNASQTLGSSFLDNVQMSTLTLSSKQNLLDTSADELIPPYGIQIGCVGHSFGMNSLPFIPIVEFSPSNKVVFPACALQDSVYQTVQLHNLGDTPAFYKFSPDVSKITRVYPNQGLIPGKGFVVLTVEFIPQEHKAYNIVITCHLNHNHSNAYQLHLHGYCSEPKLELQNQGKIYFPPSYTGVFSRQKVKVQNLSRVSLEYDIQVPDKYQEQLYLQPTYGKIKPNETIYLYCSFIPYKKKEYHIKVPFIAKEILDQNQNLVGYHLPGSGSSEHQLKLREPNEVKYLFEIFGAGGDGSLSIEPQHIDFDIVKVNFNQKIYATLHNYSNVTFYIELQLRHASEHGEQNYGNIQRNFTLDFNQGIIAANSKIEIGIMFNSIEVDQFNLILDIIAKENNQKHQVPKDVDARQLVAQKCSMTIHAQGSYPLLKLMDVRNDSVSVATLWENFSINKINDELLSDLNEDEQQFINMQNLKFTEAQGLQKRLSNYDWNFGYVSTQNNKPRKIVITICNIGGTELDWAFKLPSDNQIEVEPWADPGEPSPEEAFEQAIIERNIFQISPKAGTLQPKEMRDIECVYDPTQADQVTFGSGKQNKPINESHFLQVVLQIMNGQPVVINLRGETLAPLEGKLAIKKNSYKLPDTPIGLLVPVKYPIEILNVGSSQITYKIEIHQIDEKGNFIESKFNIFDIENPTGSLLPGEKQYLYCLFKPLETQKYFFELQVLVYDFVKVIQQMSIKVTGNGYQNNPPQETKEDQIELPSQRSSVSQIGSKVFFSIEEINFGTLIPNQTCHRMIILYNLSQTNKLTFDFGSSIFLLTNNSPGLMCKDEFIIEPLSGSLQPDQFIELKLSLTACSTPSVYEGEIECSITWETREEDPQKQNMTSVMSQASSSMNIEKETLFLRIKKTSSLKVELVNSYNERNEMDVTSSQNQHLFEIIFENVINDVLNESYTLAAIEKIDHQPVGLYYSFDGEEPASINSIEKGIQNLDMNNLQKQDYQDYRQSFMEDEFIELVDLIMENTFFNIIQETTRKECDLLRVSQTFVMPNK